MPDKTEVIRIEIPVDIPAEIKKADKISDVQKLQMARRVAEGAAQLQASKPQKRHQVEEFIPVLDIIIERSKNKGVVTLEEIKTSAKLEDDDISVFMSGLNKYARTQSRLIIKSKRNGSTCYYIKL